ncbi:MAG TPA: hypothetical protein VFU08_06560 [Candidatus Udaeobacter sp.]|nr:hypothetical protein [Candidatus Udaeobacter sp.]
MGKLVRFGQSDDETLVLTVQPRRCYFWTSVELFHLLLSFFSEICRPKFSKLIGSWPEVTTETQRPELQRLSSPDGGGLISITVIARDSFKLKERSQLFFGTDHKPFSGVAMCINNPDCSPLGIHG